jgi:hypothetical protein
VNSLGHDFDALLVRAAICALVAAAAWTLLVLAAVALEARAQACVRHPARPGRHLADRLGCPPAVRARLLALFVALLTTATPAYADDADAGPGSGQAPAPSVAVVDGLPLPDRVPGRAAGHAFAHVRGAATVEVGPGDSLWRIARRLLPAGASDPEVADTVADLFEANARVIGPDPDRLRPGQRLRVDLPTSFPVPTTTTTTEGP